MLLGLGRQTLSKGHAMTDPGVYTSPTLNLDLTSGVLDPRITFTRATGAATYFDATGTMQNAGTNVARFDYDPVTLQPRGLLIEEARSNGALNSADASNASWGRTNSAVAAPITVANQMIAPDGTLTGTYVSYPAVPAASNFSDLVVVGAGYTATVAPYTFSVWLKGLVGGEQTYLSATPDAVTFYRLPVTLTTSWQRFSLITPNLTAAPWYFVIGTDRRDASQGATPAQIIYVWGAQIEQGAFATSYIPTTGAAATRAVDVAAIVSPLGSWFTAGIGTLMCEYSPIGEIAGGFSSAISLIITATPNADSIDLYRAAATTNNGGRIFNASTGRFDIGSGLGTTAFGAITKAAIAYSVNTGQIAVNGVLSAVQGAGSVPAVDRLQLFGADRFQTTMSGYMRRARYWNYVLPSDQLAQATV